MTVFDESQIASGTFAAFGGRNSQLQQPFRAKLGNPLTGEVLVAPESRLYAGQVYLHDVTGDFALPDDSTTGREDQPAGFYTGLLKKNTIDSALIIFGTEVEVKWRNNRLIVTDLAAEASAYLEGVGARQREVVDIGQVAYSLLHPTDPPSMGVVIEGARYILASVWYDVPLTVEPDFSAYLSGLAAGQGKAIQVEVDPTDASITLTAGSAFTDTSRDSTTGAVDHSLVFANYPSGVDNNLYTVGWVKVYQGMTTITEQDIYPAAEWFSKGPSGVSVVDLPDLGDVANTATYTTNFVVVGDGSQFETRLLNFNNLGDVYNTLDPTLSSSTFVKSDGVKWDQATIANGDLPVVLATKGGTGYTSYTKGDMLAAQSSTALAKVAVGSDGQVLTADSAQTAGVKWATPSGGGSGSGLTSGGRMTGPDSGLTNWNNGDTYTIQFDTESYDTDSYIDIGSDNTLLYVTSGAFFRVEINLRLDSGASPGGNVFVYTGGTGPAFGTTVYMSYGSTDYRISAGWEGNIASASAIVFVMENRSGQALTLVSCQATITRLGDTLT